MGLLIEIQPYYISHLKYEAGSGRSCFIAAVMYAVVAIVCIVYLNVGRTDSEATNEEIWQMEKPVRYERMKLGVRYGAIDVQEKF